MRVVLFALGSMPVPLIPRTRWLNIFSRARVLTAVGEIAVRTVRRNEFLVIVTSERDAFQDRVHFTDDPIRPVGLMNQLVMGWAYAWTVILALWIWVYLRSLR